VLAVLTNTFIADIGSRTHRWAGYLTGVLVVVRLVWGFIGSKHARLADFIPILRQVRRHLDAFATETPSVHDGHNPLGALMVFALLGLLALLCLTGLLGQATHPRGDSWITLLHAVAADTLVIMVVFHVGAVVVMSRIEGGGLIVAMLTGRQRSGPTAKTGDTIDLP
jgi:cytochrome b